MGRFELRDVPPTIAVHLPPDAQLYFPEQGKTADVAFARGRAHTVVVKRCGHPIYLDWLRRERGALEALGGTGLPVPTTLGYTEQDSGGSRVGWLVMSRLRGQPLLSVLGDEPEPMRVRLLRQLGELARRLHDSPVPPALVRGESWMTRQLAQARRNLGWCDGTGEQLGELERCQPSAVPERLIHGDLALDNVLVDERGAMSLIDWADGGPGDPRHDIALALQARPAAGLTPRIVDAFFEGYASAPVDPATRRWFELLYDFF